jgi:hypothetical protein
MLQQAQMQTVLQQKARMQAVLQKTARQPSAPAAVGRKPRTARTELACREKVVMCFASFDTPG